MKNTFSIYSVVICHISRVVIFGYILTNVSFNALCCSVLAWFADTWDIQPMKSPTPTIGAPVLTLCDYLKIGQFNRYNSSWFVFVVEIQGIRDNEPHGVLVTVEPSHASEANTTQRKKRRRLKRKKKSGDVAGSDVTSEEMSGIQKTAENEIKYVSPHESQSSHPEQNTQSLSAAEGYQTRPSDDSENEELFVVKRYPAYHYDIYGTMYSLTDGIRPTTLEKGTIKSASVDCLDVLGISAEPLERRASVDEVNTSDPQSSAVTSKRSKPKPPAKPLKPLPRPKPRAQHSTESSSKGTATKPAMASASTDPAFVAELSSMLKQRNE